MSNQRKPTPIRAISIRQPYVELILSGKKRHEFRSRPTNIRERVYLYAALRPADDPASWRLAASEERSLPTGVIVGTVRITGCQWDGRRQCYAYALRDAVRFRAPVMASNQPTPCFWRPKLVSRRPARRG